MRMLICAAAASFALAAAPVWAEHAKAPFLPSDAIDLAALLPTPPAPDSLVTKAEIAEIHRAQADATAAEKAQAVADSREDIFLFANIMGTNFVPAKLPIATEFFASVGETEGEFVNPAKKIFGRPRPPLADASVIPCEKLKASAAYPSGHATFAYLQAVVLARMIPEKRDAIFARAAEFAHNRIVCGVHYASDVEAGKISAFTIGAMLLRDPVFQAAFMPAKAEVRTAVGLAGNK
jgi:acid phosphatase (class A)